MKALEERGIGRPSTYASIMGTILDRGYVYKKGTALVPTFLAFAVTQLLEQHFDRLVDYDFTARMEDDLDRIAAGDEERVAWLTRFYFGDGDPGLHALVTDHLEGIDAREVNSIAIPGSDIVVRVGRYGPYLERGERARERARRPRARRADAGAGGGAPRRARGRRAIARHAPGDRARRSSRSDGRYGPYVTEVLPEGADGKPRTASLFTTMCLETVTLDDAVRLLTLPRTLEGSDGEEIVVSNGRYGPFVKKGAETRSLEREEQLLTLTVGRGGGDPRPAEAARGRGAPKPPLRELGPDPVERQADRRQGRPLRAVRHRRGDERQPAPRRRRRRRSRSSARSSCSPSGARRARRSARKRLAAVGAAVTANLARPLGRRSMVE